MKGFPFDHAGRLVIKLNLALACIICIGVQARAQYLVQADGENAQQRITRARALAAVGNLPAARSELESLSHAANVDESAHEITLVLLVGVYLEQADYSYAEDLLNETFAARQAQRDKATHVYFSLAGQVINGVRAHIERYRALGLDVTDQTLPSEATSDIDHLRGLLERVAAQGKQLGAESGRTLEAWALIEEAAGLRTRLARNPAERAQWQREVADARQRIAGADPRIAAKSAAQPTPAQTNTSAPAATTSTPVAAPTSTPVPTQTNAASNSTAPTNTSASPVNASNARTPAAASQPTESRTSESQTADASAQPINLGALLITKATEKIAPGYPPQAKSARITGSVTVFLTVDEQGVAEVQRANGPEMLRRAAEDAARRWKFRPTIINGQPVRVSGYINFNFTL